MEGNYYKIGEDLNKYEDLFPEERIQQLEKQNEELKEENVKLKKENEELKKLCEKVGVLEVMSKIQNFKREKEENHKKRKYDKTEPLSIVPPNTLLGPPPVSQSLLGPPPVLQRFYTLILPNDGKNLNLQGDWQPPLFPGFQLNNPAPAIGDSIPVMKKASGSNKGSSRDMGSKGPRNVHKVPCRHFLGNGCRFGINCSFLHPGVHKPPL